MLHSKNPDMVEKRFDLRRESKRYDDTEASAFYFMSFIHLKVVCTKMDLHVFIKSVMEVASELHISNILYKYLFKKLGGMPHSIQI